MICARQPRVSHGHVMHDGIRFWCLDGSAGFLIEVVWFLRSTPVASSSQCRFVVEDVSDPALVQTTQTWESSASSPVTPNWFSRSGNFLVSENSTHNSLQGPHNLVQRVLYEEWRRPQLPALRLDGDQVAPEDPVALARLDIPNCIYRRMRLRRALGELPRSHRLPTAMRPPRAAGIADSRGCSGPYRDEFTATLWNAQAFFCSDEVKFSAKSAYVRSLLDRSDMVLITEAHGTEGGNKAWKPPVDTTAWWSAGATTGHAGIGIIVQNTFLKKFSEPPRWHVIWSGRAAILSLRGAAGALDILVSYFHTGGIVHELDKHGVHPAWVEYCSSFPRLREHLRNRISTSIRPKESVLTIFGADFNWVALDSDRRCKTTMNSTGSRNGSDERHFQRTIAQKHGLVELIQPEMTHTCATAYSRLDRIYLNQHLSEQIDRELQSVALEWRPELSNHRAVLVARRLPVKMDHDSRPIPKVVYSHPDFPRRCQLAFEEKLSEDPAASKVSRLLLLKQAMREAARNLTKSHEIEDRSAATDTADKLSMVMRFLRAAERQALGTLSQCLLRYPDIASMVSNPYDLEGN